MNSENTTKMVIKNKWVKTYYSGNPLIIQEALVNTKGVTEEGTIIDFYDDHNNFIGKGYYGKQNKGWGFIVSKHKDTIFDGYFFAELLNQAFKRRSSFFEDPLTTAFRVFNGEGEGFGGFTIEYYDGFFLVTWYNKGIYRFKELILKAIALQGPYKGIYEKKRFDSQGQYIESDDYVMGEKAPEPLIILENGVKFAVYLNDGPMVGVFLDQRNVRNVIRDTYAKDKNVLNTFSYTGAFSVAAALGGAKKTTSVDLANRSRDKTREQFEINGIDADSQDIIVEDVFNYFKYAGRKKLKFDLVILDPPSFARSKKRTFSVATDYVELLKDAIAVTAKKGVIVASTNYSNFDMKKFRSFVDTAFRELSMTYTILETYTLPDDFRVSDDFPEGNYLKVIFIKL